MTPEYMKARIEEVEQERANFLKHYNGLTTWCETHIDVGYWTEEEKKTFDPELNGLTDIATEILEAFQKRIDAIKEEAPASYTDLQGIINE